MAADRTGQFANEAEFSVSSAKLFCDRTSAIFLQAHLMGFQLTKCVLRLSFVDGEYSAMPVSAQMYIADERACGVCEDSLAHTLHILSRNREQGYLTAACYSGESTLLKTFPPVPDVVMQTDAGEDAPPREMWDAMQSQIVRHHADQGVLAWFDAHANDAQAQAGLLNNLRAEGEVPPCVLQQARAMRSRGGKAAARAPLGRALLSPSIAQRPVLASPNAGYYARPDTGGGPTARPSSGGLPGVTPAAVPPAGLAQGAPTADRPQPKGGSKAGGGAVEASYYY